MTIHPYVLQGMTLLVLANHYLGTLQGTVSFSFSLG